MARLPLFPLNTVLFPGSHLPLRVFEPRYKALLADVQATDRRFGIALIKASASSGGSVDPFEVGTVARILKIGGRDHNVVPVETIGEQRFRIVSLDRSRSYLVAEVDLLDDTVDDRAEAMARRAAEAGARYLQLLLATQGEWRGDLELPREPVTLSYFLGTVLLGQAGRVRQALLEADPVSRRLRVGTMAVREAIAKLEANLMRAGPGAERSLFGLN